MLHSFFFIFILLHCALQHLTGTVVCDARPCLAFAEKMSDLGMAKVTEGAQEKYLPIGFIQRVQQLVGSQCLFLSKETFQKVFMVGKGLGKGFYAFLFSKRIIEGVAGDAAKPSIDAASSIKTFYTFDCLIKRFLRQFTRQIVIPAQVHQVRVDALMIRLVNGFYISRFVRLLSACCVKAAFIDLVGTNNNTLQKN